MLGLVKSIPDVAADFDRIAEALAAAPSPARLTGTEGTVVRAIPLTARSALDVGCGDGHVARAVARRGLRVVAIDVAPQMIALARTRHEPALAIDYRVADIMRDTPTTRFDVVLSVNMVHHLPLPLVIPQLAACVAPGGRLIIQDVVTRSGLRYLPRNLAGGLWQRVQRVIRSSRTTRRVQQLYDEHGRDEVYLAPDAVAAALSPLLPGVGITHHLGWRYTAVWICPPTT